MPCSIRIGTSGWHYKHWLGRFYPDDLRAPEMLAWYLRHFDTVELNNSFYHLPSERAFEGWRKSTPRSFVFAVKGSRFITHMKKLKDAPDALARFMPRAEILGRKLGPVLFQLPPRWSSNPERLEEFLNALPRGHRYAFELRDRSWLNEEVYGCLRAHNAAYCIYELAGFESPDVITADFTYLRLHGPAERAYQGSYTPQALKRWADAIERWRKTLKAVYVYFDNDQEAYAAFNALELKRMVGS